MNFPMLPPEINSGRMYRGPGSESMIEAAAAWERLATGLRTAAADFGTVTSKLAAGWGGPASSVMAESIAPHMDWLNAAAKQAECTAAQAKAAVTAHETALAAMVPPPAIDANRAQRISLAKANCLGQSSAAIADIEAEYEQMWAQDTEAMYAYARASAEASTVTPFSSPPSPADPSGPARQSAGVAPPARSWALTAAPEVISAGGQVMSTIPEALKALSSSPLTTFDTSLSSVTSSLSKLSSLSAPSGVAISRLNSLNRAAALNTAAALNSLIPSVCRSGGATGRGLGRGTSIGTLGVPQAWAKATAPRPVAEKLLRRGLERGDVRPI